MQKSRFSMSILGILAFLAIIAGVVYSQPNALGLRPLSKGEKMPAVAELPPIGHLGNIIRTPGGDDMRQTAIARALESFAAPATRTKHFQALLNDPGYRFAGWYLEIRDIRQIDGVEVATVRATPMLTSSTGTSATAVGALDETYELNGQTLKLVKSEAAGGAQPTDVIND